MFYGRRTSIIVTNCFFKTTKTIQPVKPGNQNVTSLGGGGGKTSEEAEKNHVVYTMTDFMWCDEW